MFVEMLFAFVVLIFSAYIYLTRIYSYWKIKGVVGPNPSFPFGNVGELVKRNKSLAQLVTQYYFTYPDEQFIGIYQARMPALIVKNPEDIKTVLIKDFAHFRNRNLLINDSPVSDNLFHAKDETWRLLRQKITPIFSSGKTKSMFPLMQECVKQFHNYLDNLVASNKEKEIRSLMTLFTLQLFSSCVLGIDVNTLNEDNNIFKDVALKLFKPRLFISICNSINAIFPGIIRTLNIPQHNQEMVDFFKNIVQKSIEERSGKTRVRKDFIDLLLDLKEQGHITGNRFDNNKNIDIEITEMTITGQLLIFYAAGFETSSGSMSFLLYELALNQDLQDKVYEEIKNVTKKYDGVLTYDGIQEMKYLEMTVSETLRKYPIGGIVIRECASNYTFENTNVNINKGLRIIIPVSALHTDPIYFPDPQKFDPERFSSENKSKITPCTYIPFGDGPRNCIAARFARTQTMVGVAGLLQKFRVTPSDRTPQELSFSPVAQTLKSADGVWLNILPR